MTPINSLKFYEGILRRVKENIKVFFPGLIISFFTFLFLFLCLELGLRVLKIQSDNFIKQDPVLGWVHMPDKEGYSISKEFKVKRRVNKDGFIGPDYNYDKDSDTYRVVIAGDSLTEAFQIKESDTFAALAERSVNNLDLDKKVEIMNMGIAGVGTKKEIYILENNGLKFDPDLLILAFFAGNDFYDNMTENINPEAKFTRWREFKNNIKLFFRNHSTAWRFILRQKSRNKLLNFLKKEKNLTTNLGGTPLLGATYIGNTNADPLFKEVYSDDVRKMIDMTQKLLLEFKKLAEREKKNHLVLILPSAAQVYLNGSEGFYPERINEVLKKYFESESIKYIDLLPDLKNQYKMRPEELLYFPIDGHPNENFHRIVAEKLADYLNELVTK